MPRPRIDDTTTIARFVSSGMSTMIRAASCMHRNVPVRLRATVASHVVEGEVEERDHRAAAGVGDEQVQAGQLVAHPGEQLGDRRPVGGVGRTGRRAAGPAPATFSRVRRASSRSSTVAGDEHDVGAVVHELLGDAVADALAGAGDQCPLPGERPRGRRAHGAVPSRIAAARRTWPATIGPRSAIRGSVDSPRTHRA